jgi:hypothetical protein
MNTKFEKGDKVISMVSNQNLKKNALYLVTNVRTEFTPFGGFTFYTVKDAETGAEREISNGHLLLDKA